MGLVRAILMLVFVAFLIGTTVAFYIEGFCLLVLAIENSLAWNAEAGLLYFFLSLIVFWIGSIFSKITKHLGDSINWE